MATLAQQRQAIRDGITASRAATGADERRAISRRLEAERRGIKEDLNALEKSPRRSAQLPRVERRGGVAPAMGVGHWNPSRLPSGGGGLTSPIEEVSRTLHPPRVVWSSDGLVAFSLQRTNELVMRDAQGVEETRIFPNAP